MNDNKIYYYLEVNNCRDAYIVKAQNKKVAIETVYNWLTEVYPPYLMEEKGYEPYHRKDITCKRLDDCLDDVGMLEIQEYEE